MKHNMSKTNDGLRFDIFDQFKIIHRLAINKSYANIQLPFF